MPRQGPGIGKALLPLFASSQFLIREAAKWHRMD